MSQPESDPGTGVKEVIDLLLKAPPERLWSLTCQLGSTTEEDIVHALCLFILHRVIQALEKLHAHRDNVLANHLLEKWQRDTRSIEEFKVLCGNPQESESLVTLARIFKVLTQHGFCDRGLLNLAYKRALPRESSDSDVFKYNHFMEEAKEVCGPEIVEFLCTFNNLKLVSGFHNKAEAGNPSATTGLAQPQSSNDPTSLQSITSVPSLPSHLEISVRSTDPQAPQAPVAGSAMTRSPSGLATESAQSNFTMNPSLPFKCPNQPIEPIIKPPEEPLEAAAQEDTEQEEVTFYSFVILHAQGEQDEIMADDLKERIKGIIKSDGATFSNEFTIPGKPEISCVDDAINNSAFTLLLLTKNFNKFLELKSNSALVNSIRDPAKHDTVIPLLPRSNAMPIDNIPMVLKTLIPLVENRHFERKILQALSPARIGRQKKEWMKKQRVKTQKEKQEKLKMFNEQQLREIEERREMFLLQQERLRLLNEKYNVIPELRMRPDEGSWLQQHPHISISNAQCVIIGNNSQMSVDRNKEPGHKEEEP